jgi:hypothetical protein
VQTVDPALFSGQNDPAGHCVGVAVREAQKLPAGQGSWEAGEGQYRAAGQFD